MTMESKRTDAEERNLQFRWKLCFSTVCKACDILNRAIKILKELVDYVIDVLNHFIERLFEAFNKLVPIIEEIKEVYIYPQSYPHYVDNFSFNTNTRGYPQPIPCRARSRC